MIRAGAFESVGGFDPTAAAGEEPELCQRLRRAGWSIWRVDAEMTRHDLGMTRFRQWWRRQYRSGYNGLDILTRFPEGGRFFARGLIRSRAWGIGWPLAVALAGLAGGMIGGPSVGAAAAALVASALPLQMLRLAVKARERVDGPGTALAFGVLTMVAKWAELAGQVGYVVDRRRGRMARLIEYKRVDGGRDGAPTVVEADARP